MRRNKFNARRTVVDGISFDSMAEAHRYGELKLLERAGDISDIEVHPVYPIEVNGIHICKVILDFAYTDRNGCRVHEDVKSGPTNTALSKLKRKMVEAAHSIDVEIVT